MKIFIRNYVNLPLLESQLFQLFITIAPITLIIKVPANIPIPEPTVGFVLNEILKVPYIFSWFCSS